MLRKEELIRQVSLGAPAFRRNDSIVALNSNQLLSKGIHNASYLLKKLSAIYATSTKVCPVVQMGNTTWWTSVGGKYGVNILMTVEVK